MGERTKNIKIFEVNPEYVEYLSPHAPHLFHNSKNSQRNSRKYIGVIIVVDGKEYFAPLSSYKDKHKRMKETVDFIKVKNYGVINLNNMFPVPAESYTYVNIASEKNENYRALLQAEYRFIKSIQEKIRKNAEIVYHHKLQNGNNTSLSKRCNDFKKLEEAYQEWIEK